MSGLCSKLKHWSMQLWPRSVDAVWFGSQKKSSHQKWFSTTILKDWNKMIMISCQKLMKERLEGKKMQISQVLSLLSEKDAFKLLSSYSKGKIPSFRKPWNLLRPFHTSWNSQSSELLKLQWPWSEKVFQMSSNIMTAINRFLSKMKFWSNTWENGPFKVSCGVLLVLLPSWTEDSFQRSLPKSCQLMKSHYHQCLVKLKEWQELLTFLSTIKSELKMESGLYGKRRFLPLILIHKRSLMLMSLSPQSIPWDINKFSVHGFQSIDHFCCVVHQVLVKQWP